MNFSFKRWFGTAWFCLLQGAFVFLSGASPLNVLFYEVAFEGATQFHHSNWRLPLKVERGLNRVFVTPRMHGNSPLGYT
jgi:sterol desaturase/sphingolipid hydroxylase (fatty acid hydroxylase superfamily)